MKSYSDSSAGIINFSQWDRCLIEFVFLVPYVDRCAAARSCQKCFPSTFFALAETQADWLPKTSLPLPTEMYLAPIATFQFQELQNDNVTLRKSYQHDFRYHDLVGKDRVLSTAPLLRFPFCGASAKKCRWRGGRKKGKTSNCCNFVKWSKYKGLSLQARSHYG